MPAQPRHAPESSLPSIISPVVDLLLVGGLSLLVFVPLLLSGSSDLLLVGVGAQAVLATAINMPHFIASYRIVYRSKEMILRHKWASIWVPLIMVAFMVVAIWEAQYSLNLVTIFITVSSAYLAWHYTGQVWGMMASYAFLAGAAFDKTERTLIRTSLRILLVWHLAWFLYTQLRDPSVVEGFYLAISLGSVVAFGLGATGLFRMRKRTGVNPPLRAIVAWLAIFSWYAVLARDPKALFWVQIAHALQYLAFPIRVELNRTARAEGPSRLGVAAHMVLYALGLLAVSFLASQVLPGKAMDAIGVYLGEEAGKVVPVLMLMFINIHHYFTDGVIWKISNPEVRKELFAHVPKPGPREGDGAARDGVFRRERKRRSGRNPD
jgi:hypothetical protein